MILCLFVFIVPMKIKVTEIEPRVNIATVTIFNTKNNKHSWLMVKKTSSSTIKVGHFNLENGDTVSLGTWGNKST